MRVPQGSQNLSNGLQHPMEILQHVVVPEPQNSYSTGFEQMSASSVISSLSFFIMLTAVNFNREFRGITLEIDNEIVDGLLPSELETEQPTIAKTGP